MPLATLLLAGCASNGDLAVLPEVSPKAHSPHSPTGDLVVRSAVELVHDGDLWYHPHTGYEILDASGRHLRDVRNRVGDHDEQPSMVALPTGRYRIVALGPEGNRVLVPVQIEEGRLTEVNLDRTVSGRLAVGATRISD